jgi:hypothetical protein
MEDFESPDPLETLSMLLAADRVFYDTVRLLDGRTRTPIVAGHVHNTGLALQILRTLISRPTSTRSLVMTIDVSGNVLRTFADPVSVVATAVQITAASELNVVVDQETCPICRDPVQVATRLRSCGHCFHAECISEWLGMNTRCPVCRHDIREPAAQVAYGPDVNPTQ